MQKQISISVAVGVIACLSLAFGGLFLWQQQSLHQTDVNDVVETKAPLQDTKATAISAMPKNYTDEVVEWYATPKLVTDIKLFEADADNANCQIWETGKIKAGSDAGGRVLLAVMQPGDTGMVADTYRFIQSGDAHIVFSLDKHSGLDIFESYRLLEAVSNETQDLRGVLNGKVFTSKNYSYTSISSLEYPGTIISPTGQQLKKQDDFPLVNVPVDGKPSSEWSVFFETNLLKLSFTDVVYGDVYTTDTSKINDTNKDSIFAANGFYIKAPDGTFKVYSAMIDLGGNVPKITWNGGGENTSRYSYQTQSGCGTANYAADVSDILSDDNLIKLGMTAKGDAVYGYKDPNDKILKDFYTEYQQLSANDSLIDVPKNLTYDQFLGTHPFFFWKDSFGRTIQFMNQQYVGAGGCGKPVIYLYPEKTQNISVQVTPTGGMTVSDPAYNGGWNVTADIQSNLLNLADHKTYPYLFWEGSGDSIYHMPTRGFVVAKENIGSFFDEKLAQSGLIAKEIADFKEFWVPKMALENKPYYFVTFVDRKTIDTLAPLTITPKPDTVIRVLMDYKALDAPINVQGFDIKTPKRTGFVATEWGGVLK